MIGKRLLELRKPRTGELLTFKTRQYFVFPDCRVFDNARKRFLKQFLHHHGYLTVALTDDNHKKHVTIGVHNLAASCFLRLLENGEEVHHRDHCKTNNDLSNLEIISASEHSRQHNFEKWANGTMDGMAAKLSTKMKEAWASGTFDGIGEKIRKAWKNGTYAGVTEKAAAKTRNVGSNYKPARQVAQLTMDGRLVRVWPSVGETGRNGFNIGAVSECCNGKRSFHKNFKWMFYDTYLTRQPTAQQRWNARQTYLNFSE